MTPPWSELARLMLGSVLLFIGLVAGVIAALRSRGDRRILVWFAALTGIYGLRMIVRFVLTQPGYGPGSNPVLSIADAIISYFVLVVGALFNMELTRGAMRRAMKVVLWLALALVAGAIVLVILGKSPDLLQGVNNLLAVALLGLVVVTAVVPKLSKRYFVVPARALAIGSAVLAVVAIYINGSEFLGLQRFDALEPPAFAIFVCSLGYVAAEKVFANERRLVSIENELEIARGIQNSILPSAIPQMERAHLAAAYLPMTSVAGDFYEFVVIDRHRVGILVADVSGHGVPAAMIASMIKVAMQSVVDCADDPSAVIRGLNRVLSSQLRGQFVTAAYLWIDTEAGTGRYSAAGHPPLLFWRDSDKQLRKVESNGLLIGVLPDAEYPVCDLALNCGDRFLLYTDGVIEAENSSGQAFGDSRLEEVLRTQRALPALEFSDRLLAEVKVWQPQTEQQDDITLVVLDIV